MVCCPREGKGAKERYEKGWQDRAKTCDFTPPGRGKSDSAGRPICRKTVQACAFPISPAPTGIPWLAWTLSGHLASPLQDTPGPFSYSVSASGWGRLPVTGRANNSNHSTCGLCNTKHFRKLEHAESSRPSRGTWTFAQKGTSQFRKRKLLSIRRPLRAALGLMLAVSGPPASLPLSPGPSCRKTPGVAAFLPPSPFSAFWEVTLWKPTSNACTGNTKTQKMCWGHSKD